MAVITTPARVCDRPGCGQRVTDKGLASAGISTAGVGQVVNFDSDDPNAPRPPDLCRECLASLQTWWTGRERRRKGDTDPDAERDRAIAAIEAEGDAEPIENRSTGNPGDLDAE